MAAGWRSSRHGSTSFAATWVRSVPRRPPTCRPGPGSRRATSGRPSPRSTTRARWSASGTRPGASCWTCRTRHDPGKTRTPLRGSCPCGTRSSLDSAIARGSSPTRTGPRHQPQRRRAAHVPRGRAGRWVLVGRAGRCRDTGRARAVPSACRGRPASARGRGGPAGALRRAPGTRCLCPLPDVRGAKALARRPVTAGHGWSRLRESGRGRDTSRRRGWTARSAIGSSW